MSWLFKTPEEKDRATRDKCKAENARILSDFQAATLRVEEHNSNIVEYAARRTKVKTAIKGFIKSIYE